ncbi:MAG: hypothetical protein JRC77_11765, partial [Deltaproteobacteria bacterium]|nr:hypothetical protein [Deltaproteobacteria bacterium]
YDPEGLVTFFEVMKQESSGSYTPDFLRSHPTTDERIEASRRLVNAQPSRSDLLLDDGRKLRAVQAKIREIEKITLQRKKEEAEQAERNQR